MNRKRHEKHEKKRKGLVPKLRFPEFRDKGEWGTKELGEFITERNQFPKESVPLFSLTIEDGITPKTERYERSFLVNDEVDAYKLVLPDDFAYNPMNLRFGAIGRHSGNENVAVSKYYNIFFCDKTVDSKFCEIYFKSDRMIAFYDNMAIGSLIEKRRVHFSEFLKFNIHFPLLPEQKKIANCLTSLDELITAEAGKLEAYKAHKKGLMQKLFPAEGNTVPEWRFPESRGKWEWEEKELSNFLIDSPDYGLNAPSVPYTNSLPTYLRITDINDDGCFKKENKVSVDCAVTENNYLGDGQIVIARTGASVGKSYRYNSDDGRLVFAGYLIRLKPNRIIIPSYLSQFLFTDRYWNWVAITSTRSGQPGINSTEYSQLIVPVPQKIEEQKKIADCLSSLDDLITVQAQKIDTLKTHKKGLMQGLFPVC